MKIFEVVDKKTQKGFLKIAKLIYKNDPNWVQPLDVQIEEVFEPKTNVFFQNGEATRFILKDDNGNLIGRIAAFINRDKAFGFDQPTGGCGFFECINNKEAAFLLFDTAKEWLEKREMKAMDGPINFGENDNFWGLLVDGFTQPTIGMQYNPPYYKELFESYGFKFYFEQVSNNLDLTKKFPERFWKIAGWVSKKPEYSFEHLSFSNIDKYINNFLEIYKDAWGFHENFKPINIDDVKVKLSDAKAFIKEEFIWYAYHEGEPIAFLVMFPDVNQIIKRLHGKINLCSKIKFVWLKKRKTMTRARIVIMGVKPKYQRSGIESAIFWHLDKVIKKNPEYTDVELSWVGDFNPKMRALHESVGGIFAKRHITYRCLFNENQEYHRSTIIPTDTKEKVVKKEKNK